MATMNDRPPEYEALPTQDKIIYELRRISEQLDCLICLAEPEPEEELEPVAVEALPGQLAEGVSEA